MEPHCLACSPFSFLEMKSAPEFPCLGLKMGHRVAVGATVFLFLLRKWPGAVSPAPLLGHDIDRNILMATAGGAPQSPRGRTGLGI